MSPAEAAHLRLDAGRGALDSDAPRQGCRRSGVLPISVAEPFNPRLAQSVRQRDTIDLAVAGIAAIALLAVAAFSARVFIDGDTNWHVASGLGILDHHTVPLNDPFSFTFAGKPWIAHEWGSEVLMNSSCIPANNMVFTFLV